MRCCALAWLFLLFARPSLVLGAERFPFVIPGDDATPSATDLSHLNSKPAGADGFVRIRDGRFFTDSGRLKIWGVNTCFGANFPEHRDAEKVAAHLAKLGVNGVRMHHHETAPAPRGILGQVVDGKRTFDAQQFDRQDYFLDQLHRHGIYANLNLHVGRTFNEEEGFVSRTLPRAARYDKYVLYFEPKMRALFKEFCREYLGRVNPYRKLRRTEDPGLAMIEITNENAFSRDGAETAAALPEPYRGEFKRQWNQWLARRYPSTEALRMTWTRDVEPPGPILAPSAEWTANLGGWRVHDTKEFPIVPQFNQPGPHPDIHALKLDLAKASKETSQNEFMLPNVPVEAGRTYTLSFWIKAETARPVHVDVSNSGPENWRALGMRETLQADKQWRLVSRPFKATETAANKARICFKFGGDAADLYLAQVSLRRGGEFNVLPEGQAVEKGNVEIPVTGWCTAALADVKQFMVETERGFIQEITTFLKKDLGVRVPITASQITYHGAEIVAETCDYTDIHAYWQHPRFPRKPWDPVDWTIGNTPMERVPDADVLLSRAAWRLLDRPFTLSEWNIPDPSDYAASVVPFAAMVAALQDWDGVFFFQYQSGEGNWYADKIQQFFSFNGQPVKLALFAACANLYRRGDLAPLREVAAGTLTELPAAALGLSHRIGMDPRAKTPANVKPSADKLLASPDGRVTWDARQPDRAHVVINTPASRAVWGLIANQSFELGGVRLRVGATERNYAALVLTSLDGKPVEQSARLLLAAVGSAENQGMVWNEARTSVGRQWGAGPTQVNGIPLQVTLPGPVRSIRALDGRGQPCGEVKFNPAAGATEFTVGPEQRTLWYEIVR